MSKKDISLEDLLNSLPKSMPNNTGNAGLCLKYSYKLNLWCCFYGSSTRSLQVERRKDYIGMGDNPYLAVENLVEKIKNFNKK